MVAITLNAPEVGFWEQPLNRIDSAFKGDPASEFRIFKAHQSLTRLQEKRFPDKLIYVLRDPRDVACSAAHFFNIVKYNRENGTDMDDYTAASDVVANGGVWHFMGLPWWQHVAQYEGIDALFVRYEDLVADSATELDRICDFVGANVDLRHRMKVAEDHTFRKMKDRGEFQEKRSRNAFLRKGKPSGFLEELSQSQIELIEDQSWEVMQRHGYQLQTTPNCN